jgi:hypothetical protein
MVGCSRACGCLLIQIKASDGGRVPSLFMWRPITSAPFEHDLELAVIDTDGQHTLVFPCRRVAGGWINAETKAKIDVRPTHWREWDKH